MAGNPFILDFRGLPADQVAALLEENMQFRSTAVTPPAPPSLPGLGQDIHRRLRPQVDTAGGDDNSQGPMEGIAPDTLSGLAREMRSPGIGVMLAALGIFPGVGKFVTGGTRLGRSAAASNIITGEDTLRDVFNLSGTDQLGRFESRARQAAMMAPGGGTMFPDPRAPRGAPGNRQGPTFDDSFMSNVPVTSDDDLQPGFDSGFADEGFDFTDSGFDEGSPF